VSNFTGTLFTLDSSDTILVGNDTAVYSSANYSEISNTGLISLGSGNDRAVLGDLGGGLAMGATSDRGVDFGGSDVIDLRATSLQEIPFAGADEFLSGGLESVRYFTSLYDHSAILLDVDGDASIYMRIAALNASVFDGTDFIL